MSEFKALLVSEEQGQFARRVVLRRIDELPAGEVLIRVHWSSLNYKDALSASGNRGVTRHYPHTPGIDAAGVVEASAVPELVPGDEVIVTGYALGMNTPGGFGQYIRVPAGWVLKRPAGLTLRESMVLGTAGLTIDELQRVALTADAGPLLVTGATGGVGRIPVAMLAQQGYEVVAMTGKTDQADFLRGLGASEVISREELQSGTGKMLLAERWAAAVDTVGGDILFNVVKSLRYDASVACCGLTAKKQFQASVFPFILRNVNLLGVDSVEQPLVAKASMWDRLSLQWKTDLSRLEREITLDQLSDHIDTILAGSMTGRAVVNLG